jgi:hypothetical protein
MIYKLIFFEGSAHKIERLVREEGKVVLVLYMHTKNTD